MNLCFAKIKTIALTFALIFLLTITTLTTLPRLTYAQSSSKEITIGITKPILKDRFVYEGLDYFIFNYYNTYLNKVDGIKTSSHFTVDDKISVSFRSKGLEKMYSGFLSQINAYMDFDIILTSELSTVTSKKTNSKYFVFKVIIFNKDAEQIVKFKINSRNKIDFLGYINKSINLIIKKVEKSYPEYTGKISKSDQLKVELKDNENFGQDPSLSYFYMKDMTEKELFTKSAEINKILRNEGFPDDDIINGFSKKFMEFGKYKNSLSNMISRISRRRDEESVSLFLDIAREYMHVGMYPSAGQLINSIVLYKQLNNHFLEAEVNIEWGNMLIETEDFTSAEAIAIASTDTARKYGYLPLLIEAMNNYAYVYSKVGEYKNSMKALEYTRKKIEESESRIWASDYLYSESRTRFEMAEFDKAFKSAKLAEQLFETLGRTEHVIKNKLSKAYMYTDIEEYAKANEEISKAMKLAVETKNYVYIKSINEQMRKTSARSPKRARAYTKNEEKNYIKLYNDNIKQIYDRACLRGIARLMVFLGHCDDAKEVMEKVISISSKIGSDTYMYEDNMLYANLYENKKDYANAFLKYREAFANAEESGSKVDQTECLFSLAKTFKIRGNNEEALSMFEIVTQTSKAYGMFQLLEDAYYQMSLIYKDTSKKDKYIEFSKKAFNVAKKIGSSKVDVYNEPLKGR